MRSFNEIFNEVNGVSNFQGSTEAIINNAVKELEVIKKTYLPEYHSEEIKKVLAKANEKVNKDRIRFMQLLEGEIQKEINSIPQQLCNKSYGVVEFELIRYDLACMSNEEIIKFAQDNSFDSTIVRMCKGTLFQRADGLGKDKGEEAANLKMSAKMIRLETRETIIQDYKNAMNSLDVNSIFAGLEVGAQISLANEGFEQRILNKAGIDRVKSVKHHGQWEPNSEQSQVEPKQFR